MKAAVLQEVRTPMRIDDVQIGKSRSREVLIRTAVAGACHSDLHFIEGAYPYPLPAVLGHESARIVGSRVGTAIAALRMHWRRPWLGCGRRWLRARLAGRRLGPHAAMVTAARRGTTTAAWSFSIRAGGIRRRRGVERVATMKG